MADTFQAGQIAVTGAAQQLTAIPHSTSGVVLKAHSGNTGKIYLGNDNTVSSTTGFEVDPGGSVPLAVLNPSKLWMIGTAADRLGWATVKP